MSSLTSNVWLFCVINTHVYLEVVKWLCSYIRRGPLINTTESHTANYTRKFLQCTLFFTREQSREGEIKAEHKKIAQFPCPLRQFRIIGCGCSECTDFFVGFCAKPWNSFPSTVRNCSLIALDSLSKNVCLTTCMSLYSAHKEGAHPHPQNKTSFQAVFYTHTHAYNV